MYDWLQQMMTQIRPLKSPLSEHTRLIEDIGLDSLALLELSAKLEDEFSIVLNAQHMRAVRTVGDVCALVTSLRGHVAVGGAG